MRKYHIHIKIFQNCMINKYLFINGLQLFSHPKFTQKFLACLSSIFVLSLCNFSYFFLLTKVKMENVEGMKIMYQIKF